VAGFLLEVFMTNSKTRADESSPREASGQADALDKSNASYLQAILHRRSRETGIFEGLYPEDRQMFFAFVAKVV